MIALNTRPVPGTLVVGGGPTMAVRVHRGVLRGQAAMIVSVLFSSRARFTPAAVFVIAAAALAAPLPSLAQFENAPFNERPASASVTIENSRSHAGTFGLSTPARVCGEVPAELNFAGTPAFIVQFYPDDGIGEIQDISFDSKVLVGGVTETSSFFLSVAVKSAAVGSPPAFVLDPSRPGMSGRATLESPEPGTLELTVRGSNELGAEIRLTLKCGPRA